MQLLFSLRGHVFICFFLFSQYIYSQGQLSVFYRANPVWKELKQRSVLHTLQPAIIICLFLFPRTKKVK